MSFNKRRNNSTLWKKLEFSPLHEFNEIITALVHWILNYSQQLASLALH